MIKYQKTNTQELKSQIFEQYGVRLSVKREDLNHPFVNGNKWWKLKYNLEEASTQGKNTLLTFGGAYSNHIYATAAAARELGLKSIGIIRGEETVPLNKTLSFAKTCGMQIHYQSREVYRKKSELEYIQSLHNQFGNFYLIPEGGTNAQAVRGCKEFAVKLAEETDFDYLCLPVGTGGTMAGMIDGLDDSHHIIGFSSLKGGTFLEGDIKSHTSKIGNWQLIHDYHFGGYAKFTKLLQEWTTQFENENNISLDPVYTSKMMFGVFDLLKKDFFRRGSTILVLHTGGLQGKANS